MHTNKLWTFLALMLGASACFSDASDLDPHAEDEPVTSVEQAVINGTLVDPRIAAISTVVSVINIYAGTSCSGALLTNSLVVTAKHCVAASSNPKSYVVTMGNQRNFANGLRRHPNLDVAVLHVDTPFIAPDPNAPPQLPFSDHGFERTVYHGEPIVPGSDTRVPIPAVYLEEGGKTLNCYGFGFSTPTSGSGSLRQANLTIPLCTTSTRGEPGPCSVPRSAANDPRGWPPARYNTLMLMPNSAGQRLVQGDSGGPCFYGDKLVSVFSAFDPATGAMYEVNAWAWSSWLDTI